VEDILPKVSSLVSPDFGNIQADRRSNSIVVTDNTNRLGVIARMIESFDVRDRAVLIEAKIIQILLTDDYQWGINWQYVFDRVAGNALNSPIRGTLSQNLLGMPLSDVTPDVNGNVKAKGVTGNVKITSLPHGANFSSVINFLDTMVKTNMLSSPRIMALNNRPSKIHVGTNQPILTRSLVNAGSSTTSPIVAEDVKFQPVGVSLAVTPSIGADGYLTMKITPEVSSVDSVITTENGSSIPIVRTSEAESNILVKDGVTVVIGGLIEDQRSKTDAYVPILGKIPLLGMPFRNRSKSVNKTELVIFLTPHIVTGDVKAPEADVYLPPYKQLLEKKAKKRVKGIHPQGLSMKDFLKEIVEYKKELLEIKREYLQMLKKKQSQTSYTRYKLFKRQISKPGKISLIAEIKKASPSKGLIREDFNVETIASDYAKAGAAALSVLTEDKFFHGRPQYLKTVADTCSLPILMKDFMIDELQIYEAKAIQASAILLIAAILTDTQIKDFMRTASALDLDCLVEVHDKEELKRAIDCGAEIIGINNRNLRTFEVDIKTSLELIPLIPKDKVIVAESGLSTYEDIKILKDAGVHAVLIGGTFMREKDISAKVKEVMGYES
jgi:indole-3-glycerol phosphate synthase